MKILSIETSCDETGISVLEYQGGGVVDLLGNALSSQIEIHAQYGGVFPALAKRAHAEKIVPLIIQALDEAYLLEVVDEMVDQKDRLSFLDEKESQLKEQIASFLSCYQKPDIDYIAVTVGPGLEPALWVGVNTARALASVWNIPVIPINHMEGHIVTAAFIVEQNESPIKRYTLSDIQFPLLSLLVSGGHTELVLVEKLGSYQKIGQTRDDAVGEAFDKVARMLGLPYPGGPAVSRLAKEFRETNIINSFVMPRPMMHSSDYDFSFSGIKTAMLYTIRDLTAQSGLTEQNTRELTDEEKMALACSFEDAAIEVLIKKTTKAIEEYNAQTVIVGGGVAGNTYLKSELTNILEKKFPQVTLLFPEPWLATDNAVMIGMAAMTQVFSGQIKTSAPEELKADGNLSL
jgi:N6-L-threonylcarbamoyladenine synthase